MTSTCPALGAKCYLCPRSALFPICPVCTLYQGTTRAEMEPKQSGLQCVCESPILGLPDCQVLRVFKTRTTICGQQNEFSRRHFSPCAPAIPRQRDGGASHGLQPVEMPAPKRAFRPGPSTPVISELPANQTLRKKQECHPDRSAAEIYPAVHDASRRGVEGPSQRNELHASPQLSARRDRWRSRRKESQSLRPPVWLRRW